MQGNNNARGDRTIHHLNAQNPGQINSSQGQREKGYLVRVRREEVIVS
jgi:hypothetical protein